MLRRGKLVLGLVLTAALVLAPVAAWAGGDQNTNRGSAGEQIGEPSPVQNQDPEQPRDGDPSGEGNWWDSESGSEGGE